MQLIPFGKGFDGYLAKVYYDNIDKSKEKRNKFLKAMKTFIPNIERIQVDTDTGSIDIEEKDYDKSSPLHQYGEGANKLFRILVQITLQKDKKLLIDEIDAGIHYSHFFEFWKVVLEVAKEYNVQIFATTHNLECLQHFKDVLENEEFKELSRTITLRKFSDNIISESTRTFEEFEYEINRELEIRGGQK
jgi:AAA15 family ATPase/GTPase